MKKVFFAAIMALSCTFAFAGTNPVQPETQPVQQESNVKNDSEKPEWIYILYPGGRWELLDNGCSSTAFVVINSNYTVSTYGNTCGGY